MNRENQFTRNTNETQIEGKIVLNGKGDCRIQSGIGFLDHMLNLFAFHAGFDLQLTCKGDLEVCPHHTIEDIALALGTAFSQAMGERKGIRRYATCYLPMDETLTRTVIDISGRAGYFFRGKFQTPAVGEFPTEMTTHFFHSLAMNAGITLHQEVLYGDNDHHRIESLFKGFGRALSEAVEVQTDGKGVPSTKGVL